MEYLSGYTVKPSIITTTGEVLFTDGTNEMVANQPTCEAYGYTYDRTTGTCRAYRYNTNLERNLSNINNKFNGAGNTTELGTNTVQINGTNNTTKGFNNNCLINGSNNEIANGVNNSTVIGSKGVARSDCEFVLGSSDEIGQYSTFLLSGSTTSDAAIALGINGDITKTVIPRLEDTLYGYTIDVFSYRTGGTSGTGALKDRAFFKLKGLVVGGNANETLTIEASLGYTFLQTVTMVFLGADMSIKVRGSANMEISWGGVAKFYQMKI